MKIVSGRFDDLLNLKAHADRIDGRAEDIQIFKNQPHRHPLFLRNDSFSLPKLREDFRKELLIDHPFCQSRKKMEEMID